MRRLAKCKGESLDAGVEELDFHRSFTHGAWLSDQLIKALLGHRAVTLFVHVEAVRVAWRLSVDRDAEVHRSCRRAHHEIDVPGVKSGRKHAPRCVQHRSVVAHRPAPGERPLI